MAKIIHYRKNCIGCNSCAELCSSYWEMSDKDGKAILKRSHTKKDVDILDVHESELDVNEEAAFSCPVGIIRLIDENGKERK